jgi:hypothetical protein
MIAKIEGQAMISPEPKVNPEVRKKYRLLKFARLCTVLLLAAVSVKGISEKTTVDELLKFHGLKVYAALNDMKLSEAMLDHFLDGSGEPLDITQDFLTALRAKYADQSAATEINILEPEAIIRQYALNEFQPYYDSSRPQIFAQTSQIEAEGSETVQYWSAESVQGLVGQKVRFFKVSSESRDPDINASLGHFTLVLEGTVTAVDPVNKTISLGPHSTFSVRDEYNWDQRNDRLYVPFSLGKAIGMVNPNLTSEWMNSVKLVSVHDRDGRKLTESGQARNFEVSAQYSLTDPFTFSYFDFQQP